MEITPLAEYFIMEKYKEVKGEDPVICSYIRNVYIENFRGQL